MAQLPENTPGWLQSLGLLIGGGGIGAAILEIIKRRLPSVQTQGETIERYVERLRADYDRLQGRYADLEAKAQIREDALENELVQERAINMTQFRINNELETENRLLRSRYHRIRGYVFMMQGQMASRLGEESVQGIPEWVDEYIPGPTSESRALPQSQHEEPRNV